jgi:O-antigen biosynthesis protein
MMAEHRPASTHRGTRRSFERHWSFAMTLDPALHPTPEPTPDPTFTVVVPTHHRPELVAEAVASVVAQTRADWECLVVDDGGGETLDAIPDDPRVRIIRRPVAGGPAAARNHGIAEARGRIVTFLDDDDRYRRDRLALAEQGLADPTVDVAICWTAWIDDDGPPSGRRLDGDVAGCVLDATTPHLGGTSVRTEALVPFDERYRAVEDVDWWLRTAQRARVATTPRVGCELRRHPGVRMNGTDVAGRLAGSELLLRDHAGYFHDHPRAEAFRLARMGNLAAGAGDLARARALLGRSLRRRPSALAARGLIRAWRP